MIANELTLDTARNPFENLCDKDEARLALGMLTRDKEMKILVMRFGLDGSPAKTLSETGRAFNISRERVRQLEARALRKIRSPKAVENRHLFCELGVRFGLRPPLPCHL